MTGGVLGGSARVALVSKSSELTSWDAGIVPEAKGSLDTVALTSSSPLKCSAFVALR